MLEQLKTILDEGLHSAYVPTQISKLHAVLYLLEGGVQQHVEAVIPGLCEYLTQHIQINIR